MAPSLRPYRLFQSFVVATAMLAVAAPRLNAECTPYWKNSQEVEVGTAANNASTRIADLNGDSVADIVTLTGGGGSRDSSPTPLPVSSETPRRSPRKPATAVC